MVDARGYLRGLGENHVLAALLAGGTTFGRTGFQRSFEVGGFPDAGLQDVVRTNQAVLRGYEDGARSPAGASSRAAWSTACRWAIRSAACGRCPLRAPPARLRVRGAPPSA